MVEAGAGYAGNGFAGADPQLLDGAERRAEIHPAPPHIGIEGVYVLQPPHPAARSLGSYTLGRSLRGQNSGGEVLLPSSFLPAEDFEDIAAMDRLNGSIFFGRQHQRLPDNDIAQSAVRAASRQSHFQISGKRKYGVAHGTMICQIRLVRESDDRFPYLRRGCASYFQASSE